MHPRLLHVGHIVVPTYGALAALGLVCAILFAEWCAPRAGVSAERMGSLCVWAAFGTLVLSRLALVAQSPRAFLTYPALLLTLPTVTRFGLLLALLSGVGYAVAHRMPLLRSADAIAPAALLLAVFLHLGSFFAGTDLGSGTTLALGTLVPGDEGHHPVALYAAGFTLIGLAAVTFTLLRERRPGRAAGAGMSAFALARLFADQFRPSYLVPQARIPGFLRADQLLLISLAAAGIALALYEPPTPTRNHA